MSINDKLGLRRPGKRSMMKLPDDRAARTALTSAKCPECGQRGAIENVIHGKLLRMCSWCSASWEPEAQP